MADAESLGGDVTECEWRETMDDRRERESPVPWELALARHRLGAIGKRRQPGEEWRADYSRRQVRELVEHYYTLEDGTPGDGILSSQRSADWALARVIEAKADLDVALFALAKWEAEGDDLRLPRWRCLVLGLMEGLGFGATAGVVGLANRNGEVRRYMEEGLEFIYDYLRGERAWPRGIGLPRLDPFGLQSYRPERRRVSPAQSSGRTGERSGARGERDRRGRPPE